MTDEDENKPPLLIHQGGLMRCCIQSLSDWWEETDAVAKPGDTLPCKFHGDAEPNMIFKADPKGVSWGAWEWIGPNTR